MDFYSGVKTYYPKLRAELDAVQTQYETNRRDFDALKAQHPAERVEDKNEVGV